MVSWSGRAVLEPQVDRVAGLELEVLHGLGADQDRVGLRGEGVISAAARAAGEVGVLQRGGPAMVPGRTP